MHTQDYLVTTASSEPPVVVVSAVPPATQVPSLVVLVVALALHRLVEPTTASL